MRIIFNLLALASLLTILWGCVGLYPLGMSEAEWNRLSPQQQLEARERQAEIDERRRRERIAQQERKEREEKERRQAILDDPELLGFRENFCFGGEKCPDGNRDHRSTLYLGGLSFVDTVVFEADDNIGSRTGGKVKVYADDLVVAEGVDILRRGSRVKVRVGRMCRTITLEAETDDEVRVHWIAVRGDRDGTGNGSPVIIIYR